MSSGLIHLKSVRERLNVIFYSVYNFKLAVTSMRSPGHWVYVLVNFFCARACTIGGIKLTHEFDRRSSKMCVDVTVNLKSYRLYRDAGIFYVLGHIRCVKGLV